VNLTSVHCVADELSSTVSGILLTSLLYLAKLSPRRFRFVISSRDDSKFHKIMSLPENIPLVQSYALDTSSNFDDIRLFALANLQSIVPHGAAEAACDELAGSVQGSFLHARLIVNELQSAHAKGVAPLAPDTLSDAFGRDLSAFLANYFLRLQTRADGMQMAEVRSRRRSITRPTA
jgi:hypothetical protein